ncbi:MAG TPA: uroporphyrinogen-III synthase [Sphingomicrobium sp.]|nr:uroporphyrinogen-III synthase [Sphingomicrobium sp.]
MIVRPEPGARATVERAKAMQLDAFALPLFRVEPVEWTVPDPRDFDALLLTSANAVRHGGRGLEALRGLPVYAVGEATAAAARDVGFTSAGVGGGGLERLLGSVPPDLRLLHLCGEHRGPAPAGRAITAIPVYRSNPLPMPDGFRRIEGQTVAIHSPRAGERLGGLVDEAGIARNTIRIAAISEAAAKSAGKGWESCESVESPDETALLALAARLCDNRLDR